MAEAEQELFALERERFYAAFTQGGFIVNRPTDTLVFQGELPPHFAQAMEQIGPLLAFAAGAQGVPVEVFRASGPAVEKTKSGIRLGWKKPVHLYRALSLLRQHWQDEAFHCEERPCFETVGIMLDVSRNAVLTVRSMRALLGKMALMGIDLAMLYTEDTYEIPDQPYFGWMRGRYSMQELRELDDCADALGIELCPCIQTLGHLNRALHWPAMAHLKDNEEVLLADNEETYAFLKQAIQAAAAPYRSRRIHIGMDEAHGIGLGAHLRRFGYEDPHAIIHRHLERVLRITRELGLDVMMWSDMYFRPSSPTGGYYDSPDPTARAAREVPQDVTLIYWDYYHENGAEYAEMLRKHRLLGAPVAFAGGIWTWTGPAPDHEKTLAASLPGLQAAREAGLRLVLGAAWGDNGAEANLQTALPGMQLYAEFNYTGTYCARQLEERFNVCCGAPLRPFLRLSAFNAAPGMKSGALRPVNASKFLLYQDPLIQLYGADLRGVPLSGHYRALEEEFSRYQQEGEYALLFSFYRQLARVLAGKCRWHERIGRAVREQDRTEAAQLTQSLRETRQEAERLRVLWRELWMQTNKPFGFEVLDGRMGAVSARLESAAARVTAWLQGKAPAPEELLQPELPYTRRADGTLFGSYAVGEIVSACKIDL